MNSLYFSFGSNDFNNHKCHHQTIYITIYVKLNILGLFINLLNFLFINRIF